MWVIFLFSAVAFAIAMSVVLLIIIPIGNRIINKVKKENQETENEIRKLKEDKEKKD